MKRIAVLGCLLLALAAVPATRADPTPLPSAATLALKDGRALHHVKVMADEGANLVVSCDEGLLKLAKTILPAGFIDQVPGTGAAGSPPLMMEPFNPNLPAEAPPPPPRKPAGPAPRPGPPPRPPAAPSVVYKGCTIISFQPKTFQNVLGCAEVVVRNDTDAPVLLLPRDFVGLTVDGARHPGRIMVTDGIPPATKRREFVPARGQIDDIVTFANDPLEFTGIQWAR